MIRKNPILLRVLFFENSHYLYIALISGKHCLNILTHVVPCNKLKKSGVSSEER